MCFSLFLLESCVTFGVWLCMCMKNGVLYNWAISTFRHCPSVRQKRRFFFALASRRVFRCFCSIAVCLAADEGNRLDLDLAVCAVLHTRRCSAHHPPPNPTVDSQFIDGSNCTSCVGDPCSQAGACCSGYCPSNKWWACLTG